MREEAKKDSRRATRRHQPIAAGQAGARRFVAERLPRRQRSLADISLRKIIERSGIPGVVLKEIEGGLKNPSQTILQSLAGALRLSAETLYLQAGVLDPRELDESDAVREMRRDPHLTEHQRERGRGLQGVPRAANRGAEGVRPETAAARPTAVRSAVRSAPVRGARPGRAHLARAAARTWSLPASSSNGVERLGDEAVAARPGSPTEAMWSHMNAVTATQGIDARVRVALDLRSITSTPLIFGIARSVTTRSGLLQLTLRSASSPP